METEKIGFFKRIKMAIFNLEKYEIFANEKFSKALKYLGIIIVIVTIALALTSTFELSEEIEKLVNYVKSEDVPNFELTDGQLLSERKLNSYDKQYNARLIVDTTDDLSEEQIDEYKKQGKESNYTVILLKDKILYRIDNTTNDFLETTYNNVTSMIGQDDLSKDKLVNDYFNDDALFKLKMVLFVYAFMTVLLLNILTLLEDIIIVGVFGWIASKISRVSLNITKCMSLAIYSLTLSIILSTIYSIVYSLTSFEIKYFEIMYMVIAYIYMVASIMIMKDGNKTAGEVVTVEGEVLKADEDKEDNQKEEEKKDKKKKLPEEKEKDKEEIPEDTDKDNSKKEENSKGEK